MWTEDMFHVKKPIIALLHLRALPGDPFFKDTDTMENVISIARTELKALQDGGVDGVLIANEFSMPYEKRVSYVTVAAMGRIVGTLLPEIRVPFGVNIVGNPLANVDLAAATGANFIRAAFTGAYVGESGIVDTDIAEVLRRKRALRLDNLKLLYKVNGESDAYLVERPIENVTHSIIFHCHPDGLCVSGISAGQEADTGLLEKVSSVAEGIPVFCNTGVTEENVLDKLKYSDGCCVGTAFKKEGKFENYVDPQRVIDFMNIVKNYRTTIG
jgi:membrane complex biogenesis BtpA family protein